MPVLRSQRTYPLSLTADALNTGIVAAYDWAGDPANSRAGGNGADYSGGGHNWTQGGTAPTVVANIGGVTGMDGRDVSVSNTLASNFYTRANLANLGLAFGTGAYSFWFRMRAPSAAPSADTLHSVTRNKDGPSAGVVLAVYSQERLSTAKYHPVIVIGGNVPLAWNAAGNNGTTAGGVFDVHVTRSASGTVKIYVAGVQLATMTGDTSDWSAGGVPPGDNIRGIWNGAAKDFVMIDEIAWSRELSGAEVAAHQANPYSYNTNSAPADSITVSTPAASASVGTTFTVSGTYSGSGSPTTIEASFNGSAYQTITASPTGGTYTGSFTGATPGTGTLTVRWSNSTSVLATVTGVTVSSSSIAFTVPGTTTNGAVANRIFQRNASQQVSVRMTGTYTGTPTAIQYSWLGGAWATLVASPSGGVFDATVTLTGPGQGALAVRFSNSTGVTASLANVGVGDVYIVGGQSNHVGQSNTFVVPVAPGANPGWVSTELSKANAWRANVETIGTPFDSPAGSAYPSVYNTSDSANGSYFGRLATRIMATGVPVAFVPCASNGTNILVWQPGNSSNLYATMLARANIVGSFKGLLWWQGEANANGATSQASFTTSLNTIVNQWATDTGGETFLCNINNQGIATDPANVRAAIIDVATNNANVFGYADMLGMWSDGNSHYNSSLTIDNISLAVFNALNSPATATTLAGPSSGAVGVASTNFTVGANGAITGTVVVTPSDGGGGGTFTPTTVSISSGSPTGTFTYTPASGGAKTISTTNNGGLTNPSSLTYTASTGTAVFSILDWVNNAGASLANTGNINISFHNTTTRAVVLYLTGQTINSSGHLTGTNAALTIGATYLWVAESSTDATAFGAGRVTTT